FARCQAFLEQMLVPQIRFVFFQRTFFNEGAKVIEFLRPLVRQLDHEKDLPPRKEITGHLHNKEALKDPNIKEYEIALDPVYADPTNPTMDRPHFWPMPATDKIATIEKSDVKYATMFLPKHSSYFASYFTITGLHGAHVLGGVLVFCYMMLPASTRIYRHNPEHLANRVEVAGLFWHFVDLVWIFVFPLFYLL
ncbi:MAG TPA: cytochrome c oxidase subunit 3, partial [Methylomirabilota bacterium]|nr:cytochrome c oxidase subunit 3 [Methylomirabilota bacterium]